MAKHSRRRQRRSPSSSVERTQDVEDSAVFIEASIRTSGQRAPEGPAENHPDQSAVTSPIGQTNTSPRARKSPADVASLSQSALESPADDNLNPHDQLLREAACEDDDQSEGELESINALSSQRKAMEADDDPVAATLHQLREELRQLRQERRDREREIAGLPLSPQKLQKDSVPDTLSSTNFIENLQGGAGAELKAISDLPSSRNPLPHSAKPSAQIISGQAQRKFIDVSTAATDTSTTATRPTGNMATGTAGATPAPPHVIIDIEEEEAAKARLSTSGEGAGKSARAEKSASQPNAPLPPTTTPASNLDDTTALGREESRCAQGQVDSRDHAGKRAQQADAPSASIHAPPFRRVEPAKLNVAEERRPNMDTWERSQAAKGGAAIQKAGSFPEAKEKLDEQPERTCYPELPHIAGTPPHANPAKSLARAGAGVCRTRPPSNSMQAGKAPPLLHPALINKRLSDGRPNFPHTHDGRVAALLSCGWRHADAVAALEATRDENGEECMDSANNYLQEHHAWIAAQAQTKHSAEEGDETPEIIREGGEMALYVNHAPEHISTLLFMRDLHAKSRSGHNADSCRTAANLAAHPRVTANKDSGIPAKAIARMALAIVEDCERCEELRAKVLAQKLKETLEEEQRKQRASAQKAQLKAAEQNLELSRALIQEREAEAGKKVKEKQRRERTPPLPSSDEEPDGRPRRSFNPADAKWDKKRGRAPCRGCGEGDVGGEKQYIHYCEVCWTPYHEPCTAWERLFARPQRLAWHCGPCVAKHKGTRTLRRDIDATSDPLDSGRAETPPHPRRGDAPSNPSNVTPSGKRTPTPYGASGGGGGGDGSGDGGGGGGGDEGSTPYSPLKFGENRKIGIKVENYQQWQPLPLDTNEDTEDIHPTLGFGKAAYMNWKSVNEARRDQTEGRLGPITSSFTTSIRIDVGNTLLLDPDIRAGRSGEELDKLTTTVDPQYKWVSQIPEGKVLKVLDSHFSVMDPGPFLAMKMSATINPRTKEGDVNYCAVSHGIFASKWLAALAELKAGGWDESHTDLRMTYINALASNRTLYDQALAYKTTSHTMLIAHMKQWTQQKTSQQKSDLETKKRLNADNPRADSGKVAPQPQTAPINTTNQKPIALGNKFTGEAKALFTEMKAEMAALRNQIKEQRGSFPAKQAAPPPGIDDKKQFFCHGCGHTFSKDGRRIPCIHDCVYGEHPECNKNYKQGVAYPPGKERLEWGTPEQYLKRFGREMPERAKRYVASRAKEPNNEPKRRRPDHKSGDEA